MIYLQLAETNKIQFFGGAFQRDFGKHSGGRENNATKIKSRHWPWRALGKGNYGTCYRSSQDRNASAEFMAATAIYRVTLDPSAKCSLSFLKIRTSQQRNHIN